MNTSLAFIGFFIEFVDIFLNVNLSILTMHKIISCQEQKGKGILTQMKPKDKLWD